MISHEQRDELRARLIHVCLEIIDTSTIIAGLSHFGKEPIDLHIHLAVMKQMKRFYEAALAQDEEERA